MPSPKVRYTKIRNGYYHLNIPIPVSIRQNYGGKVAFEKATRSTDPREAERQVVSQRAKFDVEVQSAKRKVDQARLKELLDPADAAAVEALGGPHNISKAIEELREQIAFLYAGLDAGDAIEDENLPSF